MEIRACARSSEAFLACRDCYENRPERLSELKGKKVAALGWGVPEELIRAYGMHVFPVWAQPRAQLPHADRYLEYSFPPKARSWFDAVLDRVGQAEYLAAADSEDVVNRIYYYLREIRREEPERDMPEPYLIDLLFSRHMHVQQWNEKAYARFAETLERWAGPRPEGALEAELRRSAAILEKLRALTALRKTASPRLTGSEWLVIVGGGFFMERGQYENALDRLLEEAPDWDPAPGTRLFYTGSVQQDLTVYDAIEAQGCVIVGEDHDWGDRYCLRPLRTDLEPLKALTDRYTLTPPSAQKGLVRERTAALRESVLASGAQAVLFYSDVYEEAASWDYPAQKQMLRALGVGSALLHGMPFPPGKDALENALHCALDAMKGEREHG